MYTKIAVIYSLFGIREILDRNISSCELYHCLVVIRLGLFSRQEKKAKYGPQLDWSYIKSNNYSEVTSSDGCLH